MPLCGVALYIFLVEKCGYGYYKLYKIFPILKNYISGKPQIYYDFQKNNSGWEYYYLGYGGHLLVESTIYGRFMPTFLEAIKSDASYYRACWDEVAIKTLKEMDEDNSVQENIGSPPETTQ